MEKKIDEKLKDLLSSRKQKKVEEKIVKEKTSLLIKNIDDDIFKLTIDSEVNNFLKEKSLEVLNLQAQTSLTLGKIFTEVELKLSGNRYTGCYVKWLELNGYNKMTALRHRNRYKLYSLCSNDFSRETIAKLAYAKIDKICKISNPKEVIENLEKNNSADYLEEIFSEKKAIILEDNDILNYDINNFVNHFPKKENFNKLPLEKQKMVVNLLKKIDKIFKEI